MPAPRDAQLNAAISLHQSGRLDAAEPIYRQLLADNPNDADALHFLGMIAFQRGKPSDAVALLRRSLGLKPSAAQYHCNLGAVLGRLGKHEEAVEALLRAVQIRPGDADIWNNLGVAFEHLGRLQEAIDAHARALSIRPQYAEAHHHRGNCLRKLGRVTEAAAAQREAIRLKPDYAGAYRNLANALLELSRVPEALDCYRKAIELRPDDAALHSDLLFASHYSCELSPLQLLEQARAWASRHGNVKPLPPPDNDRNPSRILRVGYLSPDFRDHTIQHVIEPILASHDRSQFKIYCYSSVARPDHVTARLQRLADEWRDVSGVSDDEAAAMIRADRVDILVELAGHWSGNRLLVLARRPAPVQVQLAYPGTTGLPAVGYRITDVHSDPPGAESLYTERLVRLPKCAWPYQPPDESPEPSALPAREAGYVTFGCLNNPAKISDAAVTLWCQILRAVPRARLLLLAPAGNQALLDRFAAGGVATKRVELAPRGDRKHYYDLYRRIDIALDPFPYNGETTTCDALWMGAPVVTIAGTACVSRRGLSHLSNLGLEELVAAEPPGYVETARRLAGDLGNLESLKKSMRQRLRSSLLTSTRGYVTQLEQGLRGMWYSWRISTRPEAGNILA